MNYAQKLREIRKEKGLSQKDIANLLNTSQSYYAQYENNKRPLPIEHLITICKFYKISADELLGIGEESPIDKKQ